jgi:DNA-directed RNA polymerase
MLNDLYQVQNNLEKEYRNLTLERFTRRTEESKRKGDESSTYYGLYLQKTTIEPLSLLIKQKIEEAKLGKSGRRQTSVKLMEKFDAVTLAFITVRSVVDKITHQKNALTSAALAIATALEDELRNQSFEAEKPHLFTKIINETKTNNKERKRKIMVGSYNRYCDAWNGWDKADKIHLGKHLIELYIEATGHIQIVLKNPSKNRTVYFVEPTQLLLDFISNNNDVAALLRPMYVPMVVPPVPWDSTRGGGYLTHHTPPLTLIKTNKRPYLEELDNMGDELSDVYRAINTLQNTPWVVNKFVLKTFQALDKLGLGIAGLKIKGKTIKPPSPLSKNRDTKELTASEKIKFGAWAEIGMEDDLTQELFDIRAASYVTKVFAKPAWAVAGGAERDAVVPEPTAAAEEELEALPAWLTARQDAYGTSQSQLEYITENGLEAWQEHVAAIKLTNPIPE